MAHIHCEDLLNKINRLIYTKIVFKIISTFINKLKKTFKIK